MALHDLIGNVRSRIVSHPIAAVALVLLVGLVLGMVIRPGEETVAQQSLGMERMQHGQAQGESTLWTCSMHPSYRSDKPGTCPICGMDLVPVARSAGGMRTLSVSPEARALMNVETSPVERRYVNHSIPMAGKVDYDETRLGYITAWVAGRLDRLYVDFTGIEVKKGDHLVYIYSEQLYAAQEELIQALKYARERPVQPTNLRIADVDMVESAREKLRLWGLTDEQIAEIEATSQPSYHMTINAPVGGVVIQKLKQEGDRVSVGERIYTIADLSQVWVQLDAYESDQVWIRYGQDVSITTEAYPGEVFHGRIAFIQRTLDDKTRTVKVRVNVPNPDGKLKPGMFVHATVRPKVAAGGRVLDPSLAGKWICPMHPEVVKDGPGTCDICGMDLVTAESLGYVTPETLAAKPPLVIPYLAALVTGTRAIVYVELPNMQSTAEPALKTLTVAVEGGDLETIPEAFADYARMLEQPYDQPGTDFAKRLWKEYANGLVRLAQEGERVTIVEEATEALRRIETAMDVVRESFAPSDQPTFEGREIVLGPRAGDYYLVRHGLEEGELVVTQGNFKIDAEIQIQAKPSMMTPEGGGGGGHQHGGNAGGEVRPTGAGEHAEHADALPAGFAAHLRQLDPVYDQIAGAIKQQDLGEATAAFTRFGETLAEIDGSELSGHPRMLWHEFAMLLGNDAVEGGDTKQLAEADRVFLLLKGHMRRMREQLNVMPDQPPPVKRIVVASEFQEDLAHVWEQYRAVGEALATDNFQEAQQYSVALQSAAAVVDAAPLSDRAREIWSKELASLEQRIGRLQKAGDIKTIRDEFSSLSGEIGVLARTFGFGWDGPVYELHCPMALDGKGAVWYQDSDQVRNPYLGSAMLSCADRVEKIVHEETANAVQPDGHQDHSQHETLKRPDRDD